MSPHTLILLFFSSCVITATAASLDDSVYRIKVESDAGTGIQAGFLVGDHQGVITALHGVIGAKRITATNKAGEAVTEVRLVAVDVARDLALLRATQWKGRTGFQVGARESVSRGSVVTVTGFPHAIELYDRRVEVNGWAELSRRIPTAGASSFADRRSPALNQEVLVLDGPLTPGYSGGPVLNAQGEVVASICGGVRGESLIGWTMPVQYITWQDAGAAGAELARLAKFGHSHLFISLPDPGATSAAKLSIRFPLAIERVYLNGGLLWHPQLLKDKREITTEANVLWDLKVWKGKTNDFRLQLEPGWASYETMVTAHQDAILEFLPKLVKINARAAMQEFTGKWTYDSEFKYGLVGEIDSEGYFRLRGAKSDGSAVWEIEDAPDFSSRKYNYSSYQLDLKLSEAWFRGFEVTKDGEMFNHVKKTIEYHKYMGDRLSIETDIWFYYSTNDKKYGIQVQNDKFRLKYR